MILYRNVYRSIDGRANYFFGWPHGSLKTARKNGKKGSTLGVEMFSCNYDARDTHILFIPSKGCTLP